MPHRPPLPLSLSRSLYHLARVQSITFVMSIMTSPTRRRTVLEIESIWLMDLMNYPTVEPAGQAPCISFYGTPEQPPFPAGDKNAAISRSADSTDFPMASQAYHLPAIMKINHKMHLLIGQSQLFTFHSAFIRQLGSSEL